MPEPLTPPAEGGDSSVSDMSSTVTDHPAPPLMAQYEETGSACSDVLLEKPTPAHISIGMEDLAACKKVFELEDRSETVSEEHSSVVSTAPSCLLCLDGAQTQLAGCFSRHRRPIKYGVGSMLLALYVAYFIWAVVRDFERAAPLVAITSLVIFYLLVRLIQTKLGKRIQRCIFQPVSACVNHYWRYLKWLIYGGLAVSLVMYLVIIVKPRPQQLTSILGLAFFILALALTSKHPSKVRLRPVVWGLGMQFVLGIIILRTQLGYDIFHYLAVQIQKFLSFSDEGAKFVFGESYADHFFAFKVLPVVVYFSCTIAVLYYVGAMQFLISKIAWVMQVTMGTAPTESLIAAGNIFIGQTEAPILVRPFIKDMTLSELHAMMTAGFATIAGGVLAAYILFGVPAEHLLCASVMNAPVALAVSKLSYPETQTSTTVDDKIKMEKGKERNVLEAASSGASAAIKLVANIAVNLIAFIALLAFVNAALSWFGSLVDYPQFNFMVLCSYLFAPIALLMGVQWADCMRVAQLLGMKTFINEFVAYEELAGYIKNRKECLDGPTISIRSEIIATYALCGFANLSSIGVQLGGISPMAPSRRSDLASLAFRALVCGITTCFITASVAGLLTIDEPFLGCTHNTTTVFNSTLTDSVTTDSMSYTHSL